MSKLRGAIESGMVFLTSDISSGIIEAANLIQAAKRQQVSLPDAVDQIDAFSERDLWAEKILQVTYGEKLKGRISRAKLTGLLTSYANEMQVQSTMFCGNKIVSQVSEEAAEKYGYDGKKAGNGPGSSGTPSLGKGPD